MKADDRRRGGGHRRAPPADQRVRVAIRQPRSRSAESSRDGTGSLYPSPVMTTPDYGVLIVFGGFCLPALRFPGAPAGSRPSRSPRRCRASPETMAAPVPRRSIGSSPPSRHQRAELDVVARHHDDHGAVRPNATSTALCSTCRSPDGRGAPPAGRDDDAAVFPQSEPDFPVLFISLNSTTLPMSKVVNTGRTRWRSRSRSFRASPRCSSTACRNCRARRPIHPPRRPQYPARGHPHGALATTQHAGRHDRG